MISSSALLSQSRKKTVHINSKPNSRALTSGIDSPFSTPPHSAEATSLPDIYNRTGSSDSRRSSINPINTTTGRVTSTSSRNFQSSTFPSASQLSVHPPEGIFENVAINTTYSKMFTIRNISSQVANIRIVPPAQSETFQLVYVPLKKGLAPGLEVSFKIIFSTREDKNYQDRCILSSEGGDIEIPLYSFIPAPEYDILSVFDLGVLPLMRSETKYFELKNTGTKEGSFRFVCEENSPVYIAPITGQIGAKSSQKIKVQVKSGSNSGEFRFPIRVDLSGSQGKIIDVVMKVVESRIELVYPKGGGVISTVNFGSLYYGQKTCVKAVLANTSPFSSSFAISRQKQEDNILEEDKDEEESDDPGRQFSVFPLEGQMAPFSQTPITFYFHPSKKKKEVGFKSAIITDRDDFLADMTVDIVETEQKISFGLQGCALNLSIDFSSKEFRFGNCPVNSHQDMMFTMKNRQGYPVDFFIDRVAHFHASPSSGVIDGFETKNFIISFIPNQLGTFNNKLSVSFFGGLKKVSLLMFGSSENIAEKNKVIGGANMVEEDFSREKNFVQTKRLSEIGNIEKVLAPTPLFKERRALYVKEDSNSDASHNKLNEFREKRANQEHYNTFIRTMREQKIQRKQIMMESLLVDNYANDVDLGMEPGSGMQSPRPALITRDEPLYMADCAESQGSVTSIVRKPRKFDENKVVKKKHKPTPTTQNEIRDCKLKLNPRQLSKIVTGPKMLDFGQMTVFASATKSFWITNELKQYLLVQVLTQTNDVKIYPESQVIPPLGTAGFDVNFCSETIQVVQSTIYLGINETSKIKFVVMGDVVPTDVDVSTDEVRFRFNEFSLEPSMTETITLKNKGNSIAKFNWATVPIDLLQSFGGVPASEDPTHIIQPQSQVFTISPETGEIAPGGLTLINITYNPRDIHSCEETFWLDVRGAPLKKLVKFCGIMSEAKVTAVEKKIEYGAIPVGQKKLKMITLKNTGDSAVVFNVENLPDFKITPMKGRIVTGSLQKLMLELKPTSARIIDSDLIINIRGGKRLKVPIRGEAKIPMVEMDGGLLNFGDVFVGSSAKSQITFKNVGGSIPAVLYLDFSMYADFHVANEKGLVVTESSDSDEPITIDSPELSDDEEEETIKSGDAIEDLSDRDSKENRENRRYKLTVEPNSFLTLFIIFKPRTVQTYKFTLSLSLAGIPPSMTGFNREVRARSLKPKIVTSHHTVDYGRKVVLAETTSLMPHRFVITLTNADKEEHSWKSGEFNESVFQIEPSYGHLLPDQTAQVQILFIPRDCRSYSDTLPIYLDNDHDKTYLDIAVRGIGKNPSLSFDVKELILPVTPLGVQVVNTFTIINEGYQKLDIKYRLPIDSSKVPIKLRFPEGSELSLDKPQVSVELLFSSTKPVSFSAKIDFYDNDGNKYVLPVTCTADNCLFTNYPFLVQNKDSYRIDWSRNKPIILSQREKGDGVREDDHMSSRFSTCSGFTASSVLSARDCLTRKLYDRKSCERLLNWLNVNVLTNPVDDLMKTIQFTNGGLVYDIVTFLSGKKPPVRASKATTNKLETSRTSYIHYEEFLLFLKTYGALLNAIRPEYLMTFEEYQKIFSDKTPVDPYATNQQKRMTERQFRHKSAEAWLTVLYQIIKIFVLQRINLKQAKTIAGVPEDFFSSSDPTLSGSNLYSTSENILLKWMSYHVNKEYPPTNGEEMRVTNFGNDLRNGIVLAALIKSHIPHIAQKFTALKYTVDEQTDLEHNASLIVGAINEARLDYVITARDIVAANPRDMLLFCIYLYQTLPQYIPKADIEFVGNLQETVIKSIELTNPTKNLIEYAVTIEGSKEFILADDKVCLKPKSKFNFTIETTPRFCAPIEARLTFHANRSGTYNPTTMVFNLRTQVVTDKYQKLVEVSNMIYESRKIEFDVENPFERHGQFKLSLNQIIKDGVPPTASIPDAFWCPIDFLALKKGEKKRIVVQYLPFVGRCTFECQILFSDSKVGEFIYCIKAESKLPEPIERREIRCESSQVAEVLLQLNSGNPSVEKAVSTLKERYKKFRIGRNVLPIPEQEKITFRVEYSSPFFSGPDTITVNKKGSSQELPQLKINFNPKTSGIYPCNVVLISDYDLRLYVIEGRAISPGVRAELEFAVPVRQKITQDIPIHNRSDKFWKIQASLSGEYFYGPNEIRVAPNTTMSYPLIFYPKTTGKAQGELELSNPETLEKYIFTLRGKADEPMAEDKIVLACKARESIEHFLQVPNITASRTTVTYSVAIDLPFIDGAKTHEVSPSKRDNINTNASYRNLLELLNDHHDIAKTASSSNLNLLKRVETRSNLMLVRSDTRPLLSFDKERMYKMIITPPLGGKYSGTITFTSPDGEHAWYSIEIDASRAPPEDKLTLRSVVRDSVVVPIPISNPRGVERVFSVSFEGHGLDGSNHILLNPKEVGQYELNFSPLQIGTFSGFISFYNEEVGEFWYELDLMGERPKPIDIPELCCPIGKSSSYEISIRNPVNETMKMAIEIDNPHNFSVSPTPLVLPPYETTRATIHYYPSSINKKEKGTIKILNYQIGEWVFNCVGSGEKPTEMEVKKVFGQVMRTQSSILTFRNPFPVEKKIYVSLSSLDNSSNSTVILSTRSSNLSSMTNGQKQKVFRLMLKQRGSGVVLAPFSTIQIPFSFTPLLMKEYRTFINVDIAGEDVSWKYPILGVAEAVTTETFTFTCQARTSVEKIIHIAIPADGAPLPMTEDDVLSTVLSGGPIRSTSHRSVLRGASNPQDQLDKNSIVSAASVRVPPIHSNLNRTPDEKYTYEVNVPDDQGHVKAIKRSITVAEMKLEELKVNNPDNLIQQGSKNMFFKVEFSPLRPFNGLAHLLIRKEGGGIFRYELQLEATSPEIDDTIEIQSSIGMTEQVSFRLTNIFAHTTPFETYFTSESPLDFTVHPTKGSLSAYGYEGTQFVVSFTANHYGKTSLGTLVIDTEEMQWRYEVRGVLPKYVAPKAIKSKIQNRLKDSTMSLMQQSRTEKQKNFLKRNMKL